ncbi:site-specific integrase [Thalassotalea sp. LPB0316]|uniref:tyrosine-type recombinase/integrase n=1 Tax=Thalassotalea sp. LPB0316 TaxID=2769490 RepID=UPI001867994C|nr:site-specific integrase [Thalassotalea sp. LPB0316]QOL26230.1 site-specific integrase [Thalassotalea sp. LPB0316]
MLDTNKDLQKKVREGVANKWSCGRSLYFRISHEGTAFFMVRYTFENKRREMIIGRYGKLADEMTLEQARDKAAVIRAMVNRGEDPRLKNVKRTNEKTVNSIAEVFLSKKKRRVQDIRPTERVYWNDISPVIGSLLPKKVSGEHIQDLLDQIVESGRPTVANDALLICKELLNEAMKFNHVRYNVALAFNMKDAGGKEKSRTRALSFDEIETFYSELATHPTEITRENYLAFALLNTLLVRKGELISAKWQEFDFELQTWTLEAERTKTTSRLVIPLPNQCVDWLRELKMRAGKSEYVFPARRAGKRREYISDDTLNHALSGCFNKKVMRKGKKTLVEGVLAKVGFKHFVVHDLRRTGRTLLAELGVDPFVSERCLNHKLKGVERVYDRHDYFEQRKAALQKLADRIAPLVNV